VWVTGPLVTAMVTNRILPALTVSLSVFARLTLNELVPPQLDYGYARHKAGRSVCSYNGTLPIVETAGCRSHP
jgi:hypothetical protein